MHMPSGASPGLRIGESPADMQGSREISHTFGIGRISGRGQVHPPGE